MMHAIIVKQNETMIDPHTLEIFEDKRAAFFHTVKGLQSWEEHIGLVHRPLKKFKKK